MAAEHFHQQVESYMQNPMHTEHDFENLMNAYYVAQHQMQWSHFSFHVMADWNQMEYALRRLVFFYDYSDDDHGGWNGGHGGWHGGHGGWHGGGRGGRGGHYRFPRR